MKPSRRPSSRATSTEGYGPYQIRTVYGPYLIHPLQAEVDLRARCKKVVGRLAAMLQRPLDGRAIATAMLGGLRQALDDTLSFMTELQNRLLVARARAAT